VPLDESRLDKWDLWTHGTQLRGANIYQRRVHPELDGLEFIGSGAVGPPYTQDDFDALAEAGANYVNFSVPGLYTVTPPYRLDEDVQAEVDRLLAMAEKADLFVVISARTGPGRSEFSILRDGVGDWFDERYLIESVWEDPAAQSAWAEMWRYTAERYRDNPVVVGYDLMVEPNADDILETWDQNEFMAQYRDTGYDWNSWFPDIVAAIRTVDRDTPILIGGMDYSGLDWLAYTRHVDDERIVYTFHQYAPFLYTHQEADELLNTYPGFFDADWDETPDTVDQQWLADYLTLIGDFQTKYALPVAVNECGVIRWEPGAAQFMRDQWDLFEQYGLNYAVWMWYPDWEPLAEGDNDFNFHFGPDPDNLRSVPNDLQTLYVTFWAKNSIRPSDFE
jgi:heme-degrading monooxygenase HmoA